MSSHETTVLMAITVCIVILIVLLIFLFLNVASYHRKKIALTRGQASADLRLLETELSRIAMDLHDDVGNLLSAIKLKLPVSPAFINAEILENTASELGVAVEKVRRLSQGILPAVLQKRGLKAAIEKIEIPCGARLYLSCETPALSAYTELHLYRIIQELVGNCCKHAGASKMEVSLTTHQKKIRLRYTDDGKGFNVKDVRPRSQGAGLWNIYQRVDLMGGSIYLFTEPGKGVVWQIEIPFG